MEKNTSKTKKESKALSKKLKKKSKNLSATELKVSNSRQDCFKIIKVGVLLLLLLSPILLVVIFIP